MSKKYFVWVSTTWRGWIRKKYFKNAKNEQIIIVLIVFVWAQYTLLQIIKTKKLSTYRKARGLILKKGDSFLQNFVSVILQDFGPKQELCMFFYIICEMYIQCMDQDLFRESYRVFFLIFPFVQNKKNVCKDQFDMKINSKLLIHCEIIQCIMQLYVTYKLHFAPNLKALSQIE